MIKKNQKFAFGNHAIKQFHSPKDAVREAHRVVPGLIDLDFSSRSQFFYETATVQLNDLTLSIVNSSGGRISVGDRPEPVLLFPLQGGFRFKDLGLTAAAKETATFIPTGCSSEIECPDRSTVLLRYDAERLKATAETMLGGYYTEQRLNVFDYPHAIKLATTGISHDRVFRGLFEILNAWGPEVELRNRSGIDGAIYRATVMAMLPKLFAELPIRH
jgi:hypothetical protein